MWALRPMSERATKLGAKSPAPYCACGVTMAETGTNTKPRACNPFAHAEMRAMETG